MKQISIGRWFTSGSKEIFIILVPSVQYFFFKKNHTIRKSGLSSGFGQNKSKLNVPDGWTELAFIIKMN